jgi:hypothetical protein
VSDIAVLGGPDNQVFFDDSDLFDQFCEQTMPLPLSTIEPELGEQFPIRVLSHKGEWLTGTGALYSPVRRVVGLNVQQRIFCGTSGGPVVDDGGHLLGVVSIFDGYIPDHIAQSGADAIREWENQQTGSCDGSIPFARRALPPWILEEMANGQEAY